MSQPIILEFGEGKVLIAPLTYADGSVGIAFSTRLGQGKINQDHATIKEGSEYDPEKYDVELKFKNQESLDVLKWAIGKCRTAEREAEELARGGYVPINPVPKG